MGQRRGLQEGRELRGPHQAAVSGRRRPGRPGTKGSQGRSPEQGPPGAPLARRCWRRSQAWRKTRGRARLPYCCWLRSAGSPSLRCCTAPHSFPPCHLQPLPPWSFHRGFMTEFHPTAASLPACLWVVPRASGAPHSPTPAYTSSCSFWRHHMPWTWGLQDQAPHPRGLCEPEKVRGSREVAGPDCGIGGSTHSP